MKLVAGVVLVGALALAGCSDDEGADAAPAATVTTYAPTPTPSAEQAAGIESAVADIYPGVPEGKAADWARSTCGDMRRDDLASDALVDRVVRRFTGGDRPPPTAEQAKAIIELIEAGRCR